MRVLCSQYGAMSRSCCFASSVMANRSPGRDSNSSSSLMTQSIAYSGMIGAALLDEAWLPAMRVAGSMKIVMCSRTFFTMYARRRTMGSFWWSLYVSVVSIARSTQTDCGVSRSSSRHAAILGVSRPKCGSSVVTVGSTSVLMGSSRGCIRILLLFRMKVERLEGAAAFARGEQVSARESRYPLGESRYPLEERTYALDEWAALRVDRLHAR